MDVVRIVAVVVVRIAGVVAAERTAAVAVVRTAAVARFAGVVVVQSYLVLFGIPDLQH